MCHNKLMPILGTQTSIVESLDEKYLKNEVDIKEQAKKTHLACEAKGRGSMYSQLQPFSRPKVED